MKKLSTLLLLSLSAMFIFSCQKAESPVTDPSEGGITTLTVAAPGSDVDTKVSFEDEGNFGMKLTWEVDDIITIYSANGDTKAGNFKCTAVDGRGNATFTKDGSATALASGTTYQAVYPASTKASVSDRDAAMATTLSNQQQTANDLTHLDDYLFMKDAGFVAGTDNLAFDYEVSTCVLEFPWSGTEPTSVELKDAKIAGTTRTPITYKLSNTDGFAVDSEKVRVYFMIAANDPKEYRGVSFTIENGTEADKKVFTTPATKSAFAAGKTYRVSIPADGYDEATDYIDEYGANHGQGTAVGGSTLKWAPVNCGYQQAIAGGHKGYPYGKLYQWGRKDGQGYKAGDSYEDATYPLNDKLNSTNPTSLADALYDNFYTSWDYIIAPNKTWGGSDGVTRIDNDPCPEGWRVPTEVELKVLYAHSSKGEWDNTKEGRWFAGNVAVAADKSNAVFFPAAGYRYSRGDAYDRGSNGLYWSSTPYLTQAYRLGFRLGYAIVGDGKRAIGYSVRCVQ